MKAENLVNNGNSIDCRQCVHHTCLHENRSMRHVDIVEVNIAAYSDPRVPRVQDLIRKKAQLTSSHSDEAGLWQITAEEIQIELFSLP